MAKYQMAKWPNEERTSERAPGLRLAVRVWARGTADLMAAGEMYVFEGLSPAQIAREMGLPARRVQRWAADLRKCLRLAAAAEGASVPELMAREKAA